MLLRILYVGRKAKDPLAAAAGTYLGRIDHLAKLQVVQLRERESRGGGDDSAATLADFRKHLLPGHRLVALDERGSMHSSVQFADKIRGWTDHGGIPGVTFVIGGAYGLPRELKAQAHETMALSPMTLPHRLALVVFAEQLYRGLTILRGMPYHHV